MDSSSANEVLHDLHPFFRVFKDGRIEKFANFPYIPPSQDPHTGVQSKDIKISPETNVSVRIFLPKITSPDEKIPIIIYIHGGGFVIESAFSPLYHPYVSSLAAEARAIAVAIEYRLAPEHPIPACYDGSWTAFKWVLWHANSRQGPEPWINNHADFGRVFVAGDSAGANITHEVMVRASADDGSIDQVHPMAHPDLLSRLVCRRVLVCAAEKDFLRNRSMLYYDALKKSGWHGKLEFMETEGKEHCFHLPKPTCEKAKVLMKRVVSFINEDHQS